MQFKKEFSEYYFNSGDFKKLRELRFVILAASSLFKNKLHGKSPFYFPYS